MYNATTKRKERGKARESECVDKTSKQTHKTCNNDTVS